MKSSIQIFECCLQPLNVAIQQGWRLSASINSDLLPENFPVDVKELKRKQLNVEQLLVLYESYSRLV